MNEFFGSMPTHTVEIWYFGGEDVPLSYPSAIGSIYFKKTQK
jgi:hypothetical protein